MNATRSAGAACTVLLCVMAGLHPAPGAAEPFHYIDVAQQAGLTDIIPNGGDKKKTWILETTGSGAAFIDYNVDGLVDAFLVSGPGSSNHLYKNLGHKQFQDVTEQLLLESEGWGQGVCVGDVNNNGYPDLFVTYWGHNRLYLNDRGKRFQPVTVPDSNSYSTGCAFLDYDRDGDLDLFIANYLEFDFETTPEPGETPYCFYQNMPVACGPRGLPFARNELLRNEGSGKFSDVSDESGISTPGRNYSLGAMSGDFNSDGWTDLYVACDRTPSILYINRKDGTFRDEAMLRGAALDENGKALSGMGVAVADFNADSFPDIFRTNFSDERSTLYNNRGNGEYDDATISYGFGVNTRFVGWGCAFLDADNDGWRDLLLVNGHVFPEVEQLIYSDLRYRERSVFYRNLAGKGFEDISLKAGPGIQQFRAARGLAVADIDNDGRLEAMINSQNERPALLSQAGQFSGNWILLSLAGRTSNRSAIGAVVQVRTTGGTQYSEVRSGGSYLSQHDLRLHFGLGPEKQADIDIIWPSGFRQKVQGLMAGQLHQLLEPQPE